MTTDTENPVTPVAKTPPGKPAEKKAPKKAMLGLFARSPSYDDEPEVQLVTPEATTMQAKGTEKPALDLSSFDARFWLMVGPNGVGKTFMARRIAELAVQSEREIVLAALDPQQRALADFFEGVLQPSIEDPNNPGKLIPVRDPANVLRWARNFLRHVRDNCLSGLGDFGGGDTSLSNLIDTLPNLAGSLEDEGVAPVVCYPVGPRPADLQPMAAMEAKGFKPKARLIALNEGLSKDPTVPREEAFGRVLRHSSVRRALDEGAEILWVPRLDPTISAEIEAKRLHFGQAMHEDRIDPWDAGQLRLWDADLLARLERFRSWLI